MRWLYRLQARIGLAAPEGTAALVILFALAAGTVARHVQASAAPPAPELLAASDAAFEAADRAARSGDLARRGLSAPPRPAEPGPDSAAAPPLEADRLEADRLEANEVEGGELERDEPSARPAAGPPVRRASSAPVRTGINTASASDLERLPGIGPALAGRILDYRRQHGRFARADQLVEVKGIGPKTFEKMRPWVVVD